VSKSNKSSSFIPSTTQKKFVMFYCYFYLILAIMSVIAMIFQGAFPFMYIIACAVCAVLSVGLYLKKSWVPMTIVIVAVLGLLSNILSPVHGIFWILSIIFLAFEIYFFSTQDVKKYFQS